MAGWDMFLLEVFRNLTSSVAEEMGVALQRAAFSPNIKERKDHSCAVFDPEGRLVAQAEHIPVHLGAMPATVRAVLDGFELAEGDVVILNDPYLGGTHLPDISMVSGVFSGGKPAALLASRAHHSDVGGLAPGSLPLSTDIYQEGLVIPPLLLYRSGIRDESFMRLLSANVRTPGERLGDIDAQVAAHRVGERRLAEIFSRYGTRETLARFADLQDYSEKLTRAALSGVPAGTYSFTDYLDDDGFGTRNVPITATIEVSGGGAAVDFSGTSGPTRGPFNCPASVTMSAVYYAFRCVTGEEVPANDGAFRPIDVLIPEGCLLDARRPRPVAGGNVETSQRVVDVLFGALARSLPDRIPAASYGTMSNLSIGSAPGADTVFSYYETIAGGTGAGPGFDGLSGTQAHMTNTMNTPVEALEYSYPMRVKEYRLRRGSGGRGEFRGGDGMVRELEALEEVRATLLAERRARGPYGLEGGKPGARGKDEVTRGGRSQGIPSKGGVTLGPGDSIRISTPGGGGWGSKGKRR
jgi:N-methylhydantoinase B